MLTTDRLGVATLSLLTSFSLGLVASADAGGQTTTSTIRVTNEASQVVKLESVPEISFEGSTAKAVANRAVRLNYRQIRSASNDARGHLVVQDLRPAAQQQADPWQVNAQLIDVMCSNRQYEILGLAYQLQLENSARMTQINTSATAVWHQPNNQTKQIYTRNVRDAALQIPAQATAHAGSYHAAVKWTLVNSLGQGGVNQ